MKRRTTQRRTGKSFALFIALAVIFALAPLATTPACAATGTMDIDGALAVSDLGVDDGSVIQGWTWTALSETLTLYPSFNISAFGSDVINITCGSSNDTINIVLAGNVTIESSVGSGILVSGGSLTINAGSYTLDSLTMSGCAIQSEGDVAIIGGTVNASGLRGICSANGDVVVSGSADVTAGDVSASISGGSFEGIMANNGSVAISTSGTVDISAANGITSGGSPGVTISGGTVNVNGGTCSIYCDNGVEARITGGTVVLGANGSDGDVLGDLTVSGAGANVTVNGNIISGNLTVSDGTVTVTGTVAGSTNVTGGTVSVNGQTITSGTTPPPAAQSGGSGGGCDAGAGILGAFGAMVLFVSRRRARG
jgi:filamentous hemagglutinin